MRRTVVFTLPRFLAARTSSRLSLVLSARMYCAATRAGTYFILIARFRPLRSKASLISRPPVPLAAHLRRKRSLIKRRECFMNRPPNDEGQDGSGLYVITLNSSSMPMSLDVPFRHELGG